MKKIKIIIISFFVLFTGLTVAGAVPGLHDNWDRLLHKYVKKGVVDYRGFAGEITVFNGYLERLEKEDISSFTPEQELAYWINAYNAFTIKLILNHYPVKSIRKINNPWGQRRWKAAGQILSLDHIEHKILRKKFKEPRIHFAIVCASIGCPDLQDFAFRGDKISGQLTLVARKFFASKKHFYISEDGETVIIYISKIFSWFGKDFGKEKKERIDFMQPYLDKSIVKKINKARSVKFKYLEYDWNLNGT